MRDIPIVFSRHARRRMRWRNVSEEEVIDIIHGAADAMASKDRRRLERKTVKGTLVVIFVTEAEGHVVISAFRKGESL
jgi:hypothetical protein